MPVPQEDGSEAIDDQETKDVLNAVASIAARRVGLPTEAGSNSNLLTEFPDVRRAAIGLLEELVRILNKSNDLTAFEADLLRLPIVSLMNILEEHGEDEEVIKEFKRLLDQHDRVRFVVRRVGRHHGDVSTRILDVLYSTKVSTNVVHLSEPLDLDRVKEAIAQATGHVFGDTKQRKVDATPRPDHSFISSDGRLFFVYVVEHYGRPVVGQNRSVSRPVRQRLAAVIVSATGKLEFRGPGAELTKIQGQFMLDLERGGYGPIKQSDGTLSQDDLPEVAKRLNAVLTRETYKPSDEETSGIGQVVVSVSPKVNIGRGEANLTDAEGYANLDENRSRVRWHLKFHYKETEHSVTFNWVTERVQFAKATSNEEVIQYVQDVIRDVRRSRTKKGVR
ncbi:hypothetical protein L6R49_18830 [Myxococcota bacterium]|nr:hypothetical protein [Myxococcota bacterium]